MILLFTSTSDPALDSIQITQAAMAITKLIAIKVLKDYTRQRKEGKGLMFQPHTIIGLKNVEAKEKR
ncbi:hypothetical protein [Metabacillus fastidiosus]|uniref:hypothetical protein n=1 Tax=Metabacillus fastidiosus TaxID=1458 RepID=UPI002E1CBCAE|nr:hypothetical protein [Metabacillus fastidiosus]